MPVEHANLQQLPLVRVGGKLTEDAQLGTTTGHEPRCLLTLQLQPAKGLPYVARLDLGTDVTDRMQAEEALPYLRRGALVSVAGDGIEPRFDHGHAVLRVIGARLLVIPHH